MKRIVERVIQEQRVLRNLADVELFKKEITENAIMDEITERDDTSAGTVCYIVHPCFIHPCKINEIKCDLMTKPVMDSVESFIPCSIFYGRPIYVYFEEIQSYLRFNDKNYISDDDNNDEKIDENIILMEVKDGKFTLEHEVSNFMKKKDALFHIQHYEKILSGVSNYKTDELRNIYKTVFGEDAEMKKPEYYEKVLVKLSATINRVTK